MLVLQHGLPSDFSSSRRRMADPHDPEKMRGTACACAYTGRLVRTGPITIHTEGYGMSRQRF